MNVVCCTLFKEQLRAILSPMKQSDLQGAKSFKLYLDTILLNLPTKAEKYKPSIYFNNDDIRDIEHQGFTIPFYHDRENKTYAVLGIIDNRTVS